MDLLLRREAVIMDMTEPFRTEDITKTDFFDYVVTPDTNDTHSIQQFTKQMRTVNAFLGNNTSLLDSCTNDDENNIKETNNNTIMNINDLNHTNHHHHHHQQQQHHQVSPVTTTTNSGGEGGGGSATTQPGTAPTDGTAFDTNFWSDKDAVRMETAILEDLNKYCWSNGNTGGEDNGSGTNGAITGLVGNKNDGQVYTLTVLNGIDQSGTWYRPPLSSSVSKEDDGSLAENSPNSMDHLQVGLDIESILSIMPGGHQINGFANTFSDGTMSPNTDGLIKSETYTYEDSGFADNKDEMAISSLIIDTSLLDTHEGFNNNNNNNNNTPNNNIPNSANNNNNWKMSNNNTNGNNGEGGGQVAASTPDSLLRSALQGKTYVRYNGTGKMAKQNGLGGGGMVGGGVNGGGENNAELRRALSTPPNKESSDRLVPTIVAGLDENGKVIFEEHFSEGQHHVQQHHTHHHPHHPHHHHHQQTQNQRDRQQDTNSVDDLLLSQLDQSFPEDFEKLKRIANEVAESVSQYCQIDPSSSTPDGVYSISPDQMGEILSNLASSPMMTSPQPPPLTATSPTTPTSISTPANTTTNTNSPPPTSTPTTSITPVKTKKYKRTSNKAANNNSGGSNHATARDSGGGGSGSGGSGGGGGGGVGAGGGSVTATSVQSSNGVRKERSLHYCSICSKGFKDKYSVNVHIRTHTGEKPFACSLCGKSFRQKAHLAKHYQTHIAQKNAASGGGGSGTKTKAR